MIGDKDSIILYEADPHGFFVLETNNKIVGHIMAIKNEKDFGFIGGFYILP